MKKTLILLALFGALMAAPAAYACSPAPGYPPSASENLADKDAAFVGTVRSIIQDRSMNGDYRITFDVNATYKGDLDTPVTVLVRSSSAACGYDDGYDTFAKGSVWAIYADGDSTDGFSTNSLSLNTKYDSITDAKKALQGFGFEEIDEGPIACTMQYAPVCGKTADGTVKTFGNACMMGAEKASYLYDGECKADGTVPTKDLWMGMRGMEVTWLQNFLIEKALGSASGLLKAAGATGFFGTLTQNALIEYQAAKGIAPAAGYFGAKTRASVMQDATPAPTASFRGTIEAVDTACFADGICSVTIGGKEVILLAGLRVNVPPVGMLKGVDSIGDLEEAIGADATVYAVETSEGSADYTLYGSTSYYVEVLK